MKLENWVPLLTPLHSAWWRLHSLWWRLRAWALQTAWDLRRPPFGISRWEWFVEPRLVPLERWWRGEQPCCGLRKPHHKMQCSRGEYTQGRRRLRSVPLSTRWGPRGHGDYDERA